MFGNLPPNPEAPKEEKIEVDYNYIDEDHKKRMQGKIDPRLVLIDGNNLIKLVEDNPSIPVGKTDIGSGTFPPPIGQWQPMNYNPQTGEVINT